MIQPGRDPHPPVNRQGGAKQKPGPPAIFLKPHF